MIRHAFGPKLFVEKHVLANGLGLLLVRDPSAPVVAYQTWYRVGSRHETKGLTGIAHLFEHLMFNQTENLPAGEFDRLMESAGGDTNAATWVDWTFYQDRLPASKLELAVRLEAERMRCLTLTDLQVESEREVVANERRFRVDDDVTGFLAEELYRLAYDVHPYRNPTIGWMEDILAITTDDARAFYRRYYAPDNATVVVAGDFEPDAVVALVEQYYGDMPSSQVPDFIAPEEPRRAGARRTRFAKPVISERAMFGWGTPGQGHPDWLALRALSEVLVGSASSRLHRELVIEDEIASSVGGTIGPYRDPALLEISITMKRGEAALAAEERIDAALARLGREPVSPAELAKAQNRMLTSFWTELEDADGKAEALGHYETTLGDFRRLFEVPARIAALTVDDLLAVAAKYLVPDAKAVVIAEPSGEAGDEDDGAEYEDEEDGEGGRVIVLVEEQHDLPLATVHVSVAVGPSSDPPGLEGRCRRAFALLRRGAGGRSRAELDEAFDSLGAGIDATMTYDSVGLEVSCLAEHLPAVCALVADVLAQPTLAADEHERLRREDLADLDDMRDDDGSLAGRFFERAALAGHAYGRTALGTAASLARISHADVTGWVRAHVVKDNLVVGFAGDVTEARAHDLAEICAAGLPRSSSRPRADVLVAAPVVAPGRRTILVDKPERVQSQIILGHAAPPPAHPDFAALQVAAAAFGGGFTSRLMTEVRVKRGWSYGASFHTGRARAGHLVRLRVSPSAEQTPDTLALVLGMWEEAVQSGFTDAEIEVARSYLEGAWAFELDTPIARLDRRLEALAWGLPPGAVAGHAAALRAVTPAQANEAIRRHWRPADAIIAVTATAESMLPRLGLADLALGQVEIVAYDSY